MPSDDPGMHAANEHICIQDMLTAAKIFAQVIVRTCTGEDGSIHPRVPSDWRESIKKGE